MAKAAKSAATVGHSGAKTTTIGGVEIKVQKPVAKVSAETRARIRAAVRSVYGQKNQG
jgi:hypothetical protein